MNYIDTHNLLYQYKTAGAKGEADKFRKQVEKNLRFESPVLRGAGDYISERIGKPVVNAFMDPLVNEAQNFGTKAQYLGGAGIGAAAGGLTYAGLGLIPALRKRKLLRALLGVAAGAGAGIYSGDSIGANSFHSRLHTNMTDTPHAINAYNQSPIGQYIRVDPNMPKGTVKKTIDDIPHKYVAPYLSKKSSLQKKALNPLAQIALGEGIANGIGRGLRYGGIGALTGGIAGAIGNKGFGRGLVHGALVGSGMGLGSGVGGGIGSAIGTGAADPLAGIAAGNIIGTGTGGVIGTLAGHKLGKSVTRKKEPKSDASASKPSIADAAAAELAQVKDVLQDTGASIKQDFKKRGPIVISDPSTTWKAIQDRLVAWHNMLRERVNKSKNTPIFAKDI